MQLQRSLFTINVKPTHGQMARSEPARKFEVKLVVDEKNAQKVSPLRWAAQVLQEHH